MGRFCKNCGETLSDNQAFCPECGTQAPNSEPQSADHQQKALKSKRERKPMTVKKKVFLSLIATIILAAVGTHFAMMWVTDETRQINRMYNAIVAGDSESLFQELNVSDGMVYDGKAFTEGLQKNISQQFYDELNIVASRVKDTARTENIIDESGLEVFRISRERLFYIYPVVSVTPIAKKLTVNTDLTNALIEIGGKEFSLEGKPLTISDVLPAEYNMTLKGTGPYLSSEGEVQIGRENFREDASVDIDASSYAVAFTEGFEGDVLFINGKSTEKTVGDVGSIAPVFGEGIRLSAVRKKEDGSTEESEPVEAVPGTKIAFTYPSLEVEKEKEAQAKTEEKRKAVQNQMDSKKIAMATEYYREFRDNYEYALNQKSFNYITGTLVEGGPAFIELEEFLREKADGYYYYEFLSNVVNEGSVDGDIVRLSVREIFNFTNHLGEVTNYDRIKEYEMKEVEPDYYQVWKINILDTDRSRS